MGLQIQTFLFFHPYKYACHIPDVWSDLNIYGIIMYFFKIYFIFLILKSLILTCVPKHEPPSHLPPHNISLGHPRAPAPSILYPDFISLTSFNIRNTVPSGKILVILSKKGGTFQIVRSL